MGSNAVKLGIGNASGYFYHAAAGTSLPTSPLASLSSTDWTEVGYVAQDGITWHTGRTSTPLKDWANKIRRVLQDDPTGTVQVPIISTTKEVFETLFGSDNVTTAAASTAHGALASVAVTEGVVSGNEAFLFIMKDGDDAIMLGTTSGYITDVADVTFAPGGAITWTATVSADSWTIMIDDGQVTTQ